MNSILTIIGITVVLLSFVATILIGLKPRDKTYTMSKSFRNISIIYLVIFVISGVVIYFIFKL